MQRGPVVLLTPIPCAVGGISSLATAKNEIMVLRFLKFVDKHGKAAFKEFGYVK